MRSLSLSVLEEQFPAKEKRLVSAFNCSSLIVSTLSSERVTVWESVSAVPMGACMCARVGHSLITVNREGNLFSHSPCSVDKLVSHSPIFSNPLSVCLSHHLCLSVCPDHGAVVTSPFSGCFWRPALSQRCDWTLPCERLFQMYPSLPSKPVPRFIIYCQETTPSESWWFTPDSSSVDHKEQQHSSGLFSMSCWYFLDQKKVLYPFENIHVKEGKQTRTTYWRILCMIH